MINISVGNHGGPHDGSSLVELALDELLRRYGSGRVHVGRQLPPGTNPRHAPVPRVHRSRPAATAHVHGRPRRHHGERARGLVLRPRPVRPHRRVADGRGDADGRAGDTAPIVDDGRTVGRIYHRADDPNNGDHHVDLFLYPSAPSGRWTVTFEPVRVRHGVLHTWLERDDQCRPCQARFVPAHTDARSTTGTIANGRLPLTVGAYDAHTAGRDLAGFSSSGPTTTTDGPSPTSWRPASGCWRPAGAAPRHAAAMTPSPASPARAWRRRTSQAPSPSASRRPPSWARPTSPRARPGNRLTPAHRR